MDAIEVPDSWQVERVVSYCVDWYIIAPENLPIECDPHAGPAPGCTVYGAPDDGRVAIGAADPRNWERTSEMGQRRYGTFAHEHLHAAFGSWHP